jgi:hypothetical protein
VELNWAAQIEETPTRLNASRGRLRGRAHQGNWQPQRNRNFRALLLSGWVEHVELNSAAQIEETPTRLQRNSWKTSWLLANYTHTRHFWNNSTRKIQVSNFGGFRSQVMGPDLAAEVSRPLVSPNLTPHDFFLWSYAQSAVRTGQKPDKDEVKCRITAPLVRPLDLGRFFSFLIYTLLVGLLGRGISQPQGRYLHTE